MAVTLRMDEDLEAKSMEKLPRYITMSALFRWALHAALDNQKEFNVYVNSDVRVKRVQDYMTVRLQKLLCDR